MKEVVAILHNIRSLHNVGSIFRTSDGAGIKKLYLCGYTPAPEDKLGRTPSDLAKTALGAEKNILWQKATRTTSLISRLKRQGYKIWAIEQDKRSMSYTNVRLGRTDKIALILGPEVDGLPKSILSKCDKILEIPMRGVKESLNVSVAYGVVAYDLMGQNRK